MLVVEDDGLVRKAACEALAAEGYAVLEAATAADGIAILSSRADIAVVFIDVDLPGAPCGTDLVRLLVRQAPWVAVVVTSGMAIPPELGHGFLAKPYAPLRMLQMIRGAVDAVGPRSPLPPAASPGP